MKFCSLAPTHVVNLKKGPNCAISGITFEDSSSRSTPKCGTDEQVSDTSVTLTFENDQVDLSQVSFQIYIQCVVNNSIK